MRFETELYNELSEKKGAIKLISAVVGLTFTALAAGVGVTKYTAGQDKLKETRQVAAKFAVLAQANEIRAYPDKGTKPAAELTLCVYDAILDSKDQKGRAVSAADLQQDYQGCVDGLTVRYTQQAADEAWALQTLPVRATLFSVAAGGIGGAMGGLLAGLFIASNVGERRRAEKAARTNIPAL